MVRDILQIGNPILRAQSQQVEAVDRIDDQINTLIGDLVDTLRVQRTGVAISAPQLGENLDVFVVELKPTKNRPELAASGAQVFINPEVIDLSDKTNKMFEACLSISEADLYGEVERPEAVKLSYVDAQGDIHEELFDGFMGRVVLHEFDHLRGKLFTDIVDPMTLMDEAAYREFRKRSPKQG